MPIRRATHDDALAIAQVHVVGWQTTYRHIFPAEFLDGLSIDVQHRRWEAVLANMPEGEFLFVAEENQQVVGFSSGGPCRKADPNFAGELFAIYLLQEFHGRGIGTGLFRRVVEELEVSGLRSMQVWVLKDNPSRRFYERHGGILAEETTIALGGREVQEVAYGWPRLPVP